MNSKLQIVGFLLLVLSTSASHAFNDERHAFIAGLGIGYHATELDNGNGSDSSVDGLATSFRVGFGMGNQFTLYYFSDGNWYSQGGKSWLSGINGIGSAYYFSTNTRTPYVHAGYGYGFGSQPWESGDKGKGGNGYTLGIGYEFMQHLSVEASYLRTNLKNAQNSIYPTRSSGWRLMLQYLFY